MKYLLVIILITFSLQPFAAEVQVISQRRLSNENVEKTTAIKSLVFLSSGGSGIFVSPYHVMLPSHILARCEDINVKTEIFPGRNIRALGRNVNCDSVLFDDRELNIAVITVNRAVRHFHKLTRDTRVTVDAPVVMMGYSAAGYVAHSYDCKITAERGSESNFPTQLGRDVDPTKLAVANCIGLTGSEGAGVFQKVDDKLVLAGLYTTGNATQLPRFSSFISKLGAVINKYPDEFEEIYRASGVDAKK